MSGDIYESSKKPQLVLRGVFSRCRPIGGNVSGRFERPAGGEFMPCCNRVG
jgi:hypothetical protein